jgi:peptidase MA superfamily protein/tetratricopeptide repeat protein
MLQMVLVATLALAGAQGAVQGPLRAGWEALQRGEAEQAAAAFRQALSADPRDPAALAGAGAAAHLLGRDDDAIGLLKRALAIEPDFAYAAHLLGQLAYGQGDLDLAISSYERVIKAAPGNARVYQQLQAWKKEAALHEGFVSRPGVRFNVMFEGPAQARIAESVSRVLEASYVRVGGALNAYPSETITAILYTKEQFRDVTRAPFWAAGAYDGRIRIPVLGALRVPGELERVVSHEFVHALIQSVAPRGVPTWLNEGLATYFEPADHSWMLQRLRSAPATIPLARLEESFSQLDGVDPVLAYAESVVAARLLVERLGPNFPVFLQYVGNGTSVDQALLLFNISAADIEREWARRTRAAR